MNASKKQHLGRSHHLLGNWIFAWQSLSTFGPPKLTWLGTFGAYRSPYSHHVISEATIHAWYNYVILCYLITPQQFLAPHITGFRAYNKKWLSQQQTIVDKQPEKGGENDGCLQYSCKQTCTCWDLRGFASTPMLNSPSLWYHPVFMILDCFNLHNYQACLAICKGAPTPSGTSSANTMLAPFQRSMMWPCQVGSGAWFFKRRCLLICWCVFTCPHTIILHNVAGFTDLLDDLAVGDGRMMVKITWSMMLVLSVVSSNHRFNSWWRIGGGTHLQLNIVQFHVSLSFWHILTTWWDMNSFQLATLPGLSFFEVAPKHLACTPQTPDRWRWSNPFCDDHPK